MRFWIGVASADHVTIGRAGGFAQLGHGKAAPLKRLKPGDGIAYYSPVRKLGGADRVQAFTAIGIVRPGEIYPAVMGGDFACSRRDVDWLSGRETPIAPLLDRLQLTTGKRNWGYAFRFGLVEIGEADFRIIAEAMGAALPDIPANAAY
ncbi:EVE domain-containing protein [Mesorhizobium sp. BR1-1-16]|uniref:EVE domain-containing protein n=1 Tax=Mesorhizobium sp. BR1-1-16 TaxID=2876653 RepID=UPI001CCC89CB|nr:EVE domain-containing protein [Mesorhizobium sp. BR1-1-16]MBZ9935874.1 EVE domain-containing protein [Mesorhizobium sp. BR1-1-16]